MSRVFFDTNVWIPAVLTDGFNRRLVHAAEKRGTVFISAQLLDEVIEKLALKFGSSWETIEKAGKLMKKAGSVFADAVIPFTASPDPDDALLLAQALRADCGYFVTNDRRLLELKAIDRMKIVTPHQLAAVLEVS